MARAERRRLSTLLVDRNLFEDEKTASAWIMAGKVLVGGQRMDKPGTIVDAFSEVRVKGLENPYVSRGGLKMAGALSDFAIDVSGKVIIDCGASTGGFTDCLLQHGASKVYSVDVGHDQLDWKLRTDPRVVNLERTNISDVKVENLNPRPTMAVADLSYLSLKKAIPAIRLLLDPKPANGELSRIVCLVKPLFEVKHNNSIASPDVYRQVLTGLIQMAVDEGIGILGITNSPIKGSAGTIEFFLHLNAINSPSLSSSDIIKQIDQSIIRALAI